MEQEKATPEAEIAATGAVYKELASLDTDARTRVVAHVIAMLDIQLPRMLQSKMPKAQEAPGEDQDEHKESSAGSDLVHDSFAELFEAARPETSARKALIAGYWLQVCQGADSFDGQSANKELNHLGHRIANITNAMSSLNAEKPALAIQPKKSGSSQQARKTYKVTTAGVSAVKAMLNG